MDVPADRNDPRVVLPAAVRAAAAMADTLQKQSTGPQDALLGNTPPVSPPEAKEGDKPVTPPVTPPGNSTPPTADWEHRYNSMKGRYDRAQDDVRALGEQVTQLQNVIATMQIGADSSPGVDASRQEKLITPKDEEDYGQDLLSVVGRKAREELSPEVVALRRELESMKKQLGNVGESITKSGRDQMFETLDERVTNWREINEDPNFLSWLALPDSLSGAIRMNLLKQAYGRNETARVLRFFQGFLAEEAARDPATAVGKNTEASPGKTPAANNSGKVPLETFAAPGRAKSAAGNAPPAEKPIYKRSDITKFYLDKTRGLYRGREEEASRLEKSIFEAQNDGRIR